MLGISGGCKRKSIHYGWFEVVLVQVQLAAFSLPFPGGVTTRLAGNCPENFLWAPSTGPARVRSVLCQGQVCPGKPKHRGSPRLCRATPACCPVISSISTSPSVALNCQPVTGVGRPPMPKMPAFLAKDGGVRSLVSGRKWVPGMQKPCTPCPALPEPRW